MIVNHTAYFKRVWYGRGSIGVKLFSRLGQCWVYSELTHGVKHIRLPYNQLNLLYCLNQGSHIYNGSQFMRPAKQKKQRIIRVPFVMKNLLRHTYIQFRRCGRKSYGSYQSRLPSCWKELGLLGRKARIPSDG